MMGTAEIYSWTQRRAVENSNDLALLRRPAPNTRVFGNSISNDVGAVL